MDLWPFWLFEENIKLVNEIVEEEESSRKKQEGEQSKSLPDTGSMMRSASGFGSNFNIPSF